MKKKIEKVPPLRTILNILKKLPESDQIELLEVLMVKKNELEDKQIKQIDYYGR